MNARGIPTAAYQVLLLLSCTRGDTPAGGRYPWWGGYPLPGGVGTPARGTLGVSHLGCPPVRPDQGGTPPWVPHVRPGQGGTPSLPGGTLPIGPGWGTPLDLAGVSPGHPSAGPGWGTPPIWTWSGYPPGQVGYPPQLDLAGVTSSPSGPGWCTPPARWGTTPTRLDLAGVPPPSRPGWGTLLPVDRWTDTCQNITFPHITYVVGNKKVLLHKCKRHTARCISSTPYAVLSMGVPHPRYPLS